MLHWFPTPYPDELLYSVLARYHIRSGNTSSVMTIKELYGTRNFRSVWDLPSNLNVLLNQIGFYWDAEQLIFNHTMYPYYAPFLFPRQAEQVKQSMMDSNKGHTIHTRIGVSANNVKFKKNFWTCSDCIKENMDIYGETYWHRIHQAPGVFVCPKHETILEETVIPVKARNPYEYVSATPFVERTKVNLKDLKKEEIQLLIKIAKATENLLTHLQVNDGTLRKRYRELLKQKGYASINGRVKRDKLYQSFKLKFSNRLLESLQSPVSFKTSDWLTKIFQKQKSSLHPIKNLLVLLFLDINLKDLFDQKEYHPFGQGPWLCLNVACPNYHKPVIKSLTITICCDTKRPVGTFYCDCGFTFSRRGPDHNGDNKYHIGMIKDYGRIWKCKLNKLVNEGYSLAAITRELQADPGTIKKYIAELGLKVPWKLPKVKKKNVQNTLEEIKIKLTERKSKWLKLQESHPEKTKTELRKMIPGVYAFLYRNDLEWLNNNSPTKRKKGALNQRVDWEKRDKQLLKKVKDIVRTWDSDNIKLTKITITSIGREINKISLLHNKADKLPKTMEYIHKVTEDKVSFQKRRVEFWIRKLMEEREPITECEIYRRAGLSPSVSDEVKRFILLKIMEYDTIK